MALVYVHLATLLCLVVIITLSDLRGLSWILGKRETLALTASKRFHALIWIGLLTMIISGLLMAWPLRNYLADTPAFYIKMFFVVALLANSFVIGKEMRLAAEKSFAELTKKERGRILISGAVSTFSWLGAFIAALYMSTNKWVSYFLSQIF